MFISATGVFKGTGWVEQAEVEGVIEGTLVVSGVLSLRDSARVTGNVTYGEIEIVRGAFVHGTLAPGDTSTNGAQAAKTAHALLPFQHSRDSGHKSPTSLASSGSEAKKAKVVALSPGPSGRTN